MTALVYVLAVIGALTVAVWIPVLVLIVLVGIRAALAPEPLPTGRRR
ncbi:hypothetical protein [Brachybacterium nesterenkovii]